MKHRTAMALAAAALLSVPALAWADQPGKSQTLRWRDNDPFVFCTQGIKDQDRSWKPIDPISGTYFPIPPYCPIPAAPNTECPVYPYTYLAWTQNSWDAFRDYQSVCKWPHRTGKWTRRNGQGNAEDTPYSH